ncbi:DNA replication and repair protein RadC [Atopostipes suicloacalis DSM 15692]|uniref:DNA replication and repair protein RadC n=1 Tax=Atopostipes suicloacalis DSM 15692 TaxID=1121025 RepID=A0A1M4T2D7_9LACT|nr:DNA repair protein RadC [Atopostipes suicloacalis]SHE38623.1 DNA replication and repair protein RadC [Atopostipes suicloacalis DSM 15692]
MSKKVQETNIQVIPNNSRPRERMEKLGPKALADHELLAIILRTGTKDKNVVNLAMDVLREVEDLHMLRQTSVQELMKIPGIGRIKAIEIMATTELGHRIAVAPQIKEGTVVSSSWVGNYLTKELSNLTQENVVALYLNTKNEIVKKETIFIGSLNSSVAHPREIFKGAIRYSAARIIVAHNHPSGNTEPSEADYSFTRRMVDAGEMMGIEVLDHFIIGENKYLSLREEGLM